MGIGFITDISIKQTKKYLNDDGTRVKPKDFLQRGTRYTPGYYPIYQILDRYWKISRNNFGR